MSTATTSASQKIALATDNAVAQQIAGMVKQGMQFQQILDKFTAERNLSEDVVSEIHEFKSRIQEALRVGTPVEQVIKSVFTDPATQAEIMQGINQYKANR